MLETIYGTEINGSIRSLANDIEYSVPENRTLPAPTKVIRVEDVLSTVKASSRNSYKMFPNVAAFGAVVAEIKQRFPDNYEQIWKMCVESFRFSIPFKVAALCYVGGGECSTYANAVRKYVPAKGKLRIVDLVYDRNNTPIRYANALTILSTADGDYSWSLQPYTVSYGSWDGKFPREAINDIYADSSCSSDPKFYVDTYITALAFRTYFGNLLSIVEKVNTHIPIKCVRFNSWWSDGKYNYTVIGSEKDIEICKDVYSKLLEYTFVSSRMIEKGKTPNFVSIPDTEFSNVLSDKQFEALTGTKSVDDTNVINYVAWLCATNMFRENWNRHKNIRAWSSFKGADGEIKKQLRRCDVYAILKDPCGQYVFITPFGFVCTDSYDKEGDLALLGKGDIYATFGIDDYSDEDNLEIKAIEDRLPAQKEWANSYRQGDLAACMTAIRVYLEDTYEGGVKKRDILELLRQNKITLNRAENMLSNKEDIEAYITDGIASVFVPEYYRDTQAYKKAAKGFQSFCEDVARPLMETSLLINKMLRTSQGVWIPVSGKYPYAQSDLVKWEDKNKIFDYRDVWMGVVPEGAKK